MLDSRGLAADGLWSTCWALPGHGDACTGRRRLPRARCRCSRGRGSLQVASAVTFVVSRRCPRHGNGVAAELRGVEAAAARDLLAPAAISGRPCTNHASVDGPVAVCTDASRCSVGLCRPSPDGLVGARSGGRMLEPCGEERWFRYIHALSSDVAADLHGHALGRVDSPSAGW